MSDLPKMSTWGVEGQKYEICDKAARDKNTALEKTAESIRSEVEALKQMSATAEELPSGSAPTASYSNGVFHIGIPQGPKGEQGIPGADGKDAVVDATLTKEGQAADAKVTGDVVSQLKDEIDYLHPLAITSFSVTPNLAEKGSTLSSETFAFAVNRLGVVLTLEDQTVSGSSASRADTLTSDKTYTLKAVLNSVTKTATASIKFVAPVYYGVSASYTLEDATVLALTRALTTSRSRTFTVNAASGQYILYALPASLGTPTFKVGGFEGGFTLVGTFDFTNSSGHTESYNLYRTVNAGLGSTSVAVS